MMFIVCSVFVIVVNWIFGIIGLCIAIIILPLGFLGSLRIICDDWKEVKASLKLMVKALLRE